MTTKVTGSVLANTGVVVGTYGSSTTVPIITIDGQGRITSATAATVSGAGGGGSGTTTYTVTKFTATAGQTVFTVSYTVGYVQVYLNGVLLDYATEFTAANGTSITLATGAALNDIVTVYAYSVTSVSNITGGAAGVVLYQATANTTSNTEVGTTGQLLTSAGAGKPYWTAQTALSIANTQITGLITGPQIAPSAIPSGGFTNIQAFTSTTPGQTWTAPPTTTKVKVTVVGGGGSSPGGGVPGSGGAAGGGGTAIKIVPVVGGTIYPVTVGAGGTSPVNPGPGAFTVGVSGGTSSFGSPASVSATGGATTPAIGIAGGNGGTGSGGDINIAGGAGRYTGAARGGDGGSSFLGQGGSGRLSSGGLAGSGYGAGGAGYGPCGSCPPSPPASGAAGTPGIVIIEY